MNPTIAVCSYGITLSLLNVASRRITRTDRLVIGGLIAGIAAAFFAQDQARYGWFTVLAALLPYIAFVAPLQCREPVRKDGSPCRNAGWGVLVGCHTHRLAKMRRVFSRTTVAAPRQPSRARRIHSSPAPSTAEPPGLGLARKVYEGMTLAMTILGTIAGWIALFKPEGG